MPSHISRRVLKVIAGYHFWLVVAMFVLGVVLHYPQQILGTDSPSLLASLGLTRHAVERVFFLLPVTYAALIFGIKAGLASLAVALVIMLPRAILISTSPPDALFETGGIIVIGGLVNFWLERHRRDVIKQKQLQERLKFYLQQVTRAQEEERRRIARELHDDTAQDLVILLRQVDKLMSSARKLSPQNTALLEKLRQQTGKTLDGVHRFSQDLRPSVLDDLGLLPALEWLTSDLTEHLGIAVDMTVRGSVRRFTPEIELVLFRIAQEALRNVWKHSGTSRAWVTVEFGDHKTVLTIKDEGKGFRLPQRMEDLTVAGKLGLAGMQERAQLVGGKLTLKSVPRKGTTVILEVPV
jgi:two-component system sensor histidine kinase DegS